ncbi:MAG: hypothetical protein R2681_00500 [Pyrinomonadaceae bacterium]
MKPEFSILSSNIRLISTIFFLFLVLTLTGCPTSTAPEPSSSDLAENRSTDLGNEVKPTADDPENGSGGLCDNPYYPLNTGISKEFKITGSAPGSYVVSQSKGDGDSFTEKRKFDSGIEVVSNWSCSEQGIRNADYNNTISNSQLKMNMETIESSGITLPKVWKQGEKWTTTYNVRINVASQSANGTVTLENEIVSLDDNVQVQAGDYVAARVDSVLKMNISMGKMKVPSPEFKMTNWYAPKVGLVKQETKGGFGTTKLEYVGEK